MTPSLLVLGLVAAAAPAVPPGAFDLLARSDAAYRATASYADHGEIAIERPDRGEVRLLFETRRGEHGGSFVLERLGDRSPDLPQPPRLWAIATDGGDSLLYDGGSDSYHPVASAAAAIETLLGPERRAAALVALRVLAGIDLLDAAPAADVAGEVECGGARCWAIDVTPAGPDPELRLLLDTGSLLVRAIEMTIDPVRALAAGGDVGAALDQATAGRRDREPAHVLVRLEPTTEGSAASFAPWRPPATARTVSGPDAATPPAGAAADTAKPSSPASAATLPGVPGTPDGPMQADAPTGRVFAEEIEVRLTTLAVRAVDASGRAIPGLGPTDFELRVGGERVEIASVDWISPESARWSEQELAELARTGLTVPANERMVVFFVQTDLHPSRTPGHLRLLPEVEKLLATLSPEDRIAVVSFDSHLKLRQDFTGDRERVLDAVKRGIRLGREPELRPGPYPSLARHLDPEAARRAARPERALTVVAEALLPFPGEKVLVFAGWGIGELFGGRVTMTPEYHHTRAALARARVTVFVLDVTQADYHSLEHGLETIAEDTGGTYEKTFRQPSQMTKRLASTLEGYYELAFRAPLQPRGRGRVTVELASGRGQVLVRPIRIDQL